MNDLSHSNHDVTEASMVDFRPLFRGQLIGPQDLEFETARRVWNRHIDKRPSLIARCSGTADVVEAVKFARRNRLTVAVRGGGHNVGGRGVCDDGVVIDLSAMRGVHVDPLTRTVRVQGGALLGDVDRETHVHGLAVPLGVVSKTGVGGLALGGGLGWLMRKYGLTADNILACEVVLADGRVVTADESNNPDLFWGLRGGGGNFGVVTSFLFKAHPVRTVLGGLVLYRRDQAADVLRRYRDFMKAAPEEIGAHAGLMTLPDGTPAVGALVCYNGPTTEGEALIAPLRQIATPLVDTIQVLDYPVMQQAIDGAFPEDGHFYWKSAFIDDFGDGTIALLIDQATRAVSPLSSIAIEPFSGAVTRVEESATAFAQRRPSYNVQISAGWMRSEEAGKNIAWARSAADALKPFTNGGYFLNYLGDEKSDDIAAAFGKNLPQLAALKAKYDPNNFFQLNQNVKPAM